MDRRTEETRHTVAMSYGVDVLVVRIEAIECSRHGGLSRIIEASSRNEAARERLATEDQWMRFVSHGCMSPEV